MNVSATLAPAPVLQVEKVVEGTSSDGFTEQAACTGGSADVDVALAFQADGSPDSTSTPAGWTVTDGRWQLEDTGLTGATCTMTETDTADATSVSYACAWTPGTTDDEVGVGCPGVSSGPSATPASVLFEGGDVGALTVTNTFSPPPTPPPVVVTPKFTG